MARDFIPIAKAFTQAEITAGQADNQPGVRIVVIDGAGLPTGAVLEGRANLPPDAVATAATVAGAVASIVVGDWAAATAVAVNEVRRAPLTAGTIEAGDLIRSNSARTTGAAFDATEAGNWTEIAPDIVTSAAGRTGAVALVKADVGLASVDNTSDAGKPVSTAQATAIGLKADTSALTAHTGSTANPHGVTKAQVGLANADNTADSAKPVSTAQQTALDAKQATLVSGTNIRSVNGASLVGAGNVAVAADLPGGAATTVTNEGLATTGSPSVDTTTVPGETIIRWTGAGSLTVPLGVSLVRALVVGPGGGGGGGESNSFGGAGGGGAGGRVRDVSGHVVVPSAVLTVTLPSGGTGGAVGAGDTATNGATGGSSVFGSLTAEGGGGGHGDANSPTDTGYNGGGGSGDTGAGGQTGGTGSGGFAGGLGGNGRAGGGGAGAGGVGEASQTDGTREGGDGGAGTSSDITGVAVTYGGGGGGAGNSNGGTAAGGSAVDGGGAGATSANNSTGAGSGGATGVANRGGGGGGGCGQNGFSGGSGVVIVRFPTQTRSYQALAAHVNDAAAATAGLLVGQFYRDSSTSAVRQRVA